MTSDSTGNRQTGSHDLATGRVLTRCVVSGYLPSCVTDRNFAEGPMRLRQSSVHVGGSSLQARGPPWLTRQGVGEVTGA